MLIYDTEKHHSKEFKLKIKARKPEHEKVDKIKFNLLKG